MLVEIGTAEIDAQHILGMRGVERIDQDILEIVLIFRRCGLIPEADGLRVGCEPEAGHERQGRKTKPGFQYSTALHVFLLQLASGGLRRAPLD
ncbi:hypothetical protein [Rhizobium sp. BK376]|uniref:hypothetical protein n=1 Tax=Rhizobium sp. BK376 TaxID=2512149 RepID=UPI001FE2375E|nr:hypothetical protein [Rhizobium sp. BK376]